MLKRFHKAIRKNINYFIAYIAYRNHLFAYTSNMIGSFQSFMAGIIS